MKKQCFKPQSIEMYSCSLVLITLLFSVSVIGQNDTIWYNKNWKVSNKADGEYFRLPVEKKGDLYVMKDFYINGQPQMVGTSKYANKDHWEGEVTWYSVDGNIFQQGNYVDNRLEGEFITYLNGKKLVAIYKNRKLFSGRQNISYGKENVYTEIKGDSLIEISHLNGLNGRRKERYSVKMDGYHSGVKSEYYDTSNNLIAQMVYDKGSPMDGAEVYYYRGTNNIKTISYYENGNFLGSTYYDGNGQVRENFLPKPDYKSIYFSENGKTLDSLSYQVKDGRLTPFQGVKYYFSSKVNEDSVMEVSSMYKYISGELQWIKTFYDDKLFSYLTYKGNNIKDRIIYYDDKQIPNDSLIYKDYRPFNGTEITKDNTIRKYENGNLIEETIYYPKTNKTFKYMDGLKETYYDINGNVIGEMLLKDGDYYTPQEGVKLTVDYLGRLTSVQTYSNGVRIKEAYISFKDQHDEKGYKEETFYDEDGYDYERKLTYHDNGQLRSEITFKKYKEQLGTFYDKEGKLLGKYDYEARNGILYQFFHASDRIEKMEEWDNGKLVRLLRYEDRYLSGNEKEYILIEDIDVNNEAKIYSREGGVLSTLKYKDKKPYEGTFYDYRTRVKLTYKNGKLNGKYEKFDYGKHVLESGFYKDGLKEGKFTYYDKNSNVSYFINYNQDAREGEATYYNENGNVVSTMIFKNDMPFEGKQIISDYNNKREEVYGNGKMVSKMLLKKTGNIFINYKDGIIEEVEVYHPNKTTKKYDFMLNKGVLEGTVVRYDENGNEMHSGTFKNGKFESGEVWMQPNYSYEKDTEKIIYKKSNGVTKVAFESKQGDVVFEASEKLQVGSRSYIQRLNLNLDYINYLDLY